METSDNPAVETTTMSRKEKRKLLKKQKRKQVRREIAVREKEEEEAESNDPELQNKLRELELEELERMERDRREFEERERRFFEAMELKKREQEKYEEEQRKLEEKFPKQDEDGHQKPTDEGSDWEYVEDGPPEIIWQGNEIIVRKKKVRVLKKILEERSQKEDVARPISNPLAPQSEVFEDHRSAQQLLDSVAQQVPNFGTEQDKAHCPFHLKTGACRFGTRCSRVHFYPDKSCTLLMKSMYSGPGLTWEQDEGLEHTDEEIESYFEDFYEDVHTEFLKFGEIVNFKVCRNGSPHLRGNIYVHYKCLESAVAAYHSTNGRYFAGKQVICEFVNLTKWKVAICGEYMKSRFKTCSRGSACNFIHCFRNPGGDYEWADWDKPPPRYWVRKMAALFGYDNQHDEISPIRERSSRSVHTGSDSHYTRFRSREPDNRVTSSYHDEDGDDRISKGQRSRDIRKRRENSPDRGRNEEMTRHYDDSHYSLETSRDAYYDGDQSDKESRRIEHGSYHAHKKSHRHSEWHSRSPESNSAKDRSGQDTRERHRSDRKSHRSRKRRSTGKSHGSDSDKESSRGRYREARTSSRRKKRDSSYTDDECSSREENNQKNHFSEVNPHKRHKHGGADLRVSNYDSCEDTMDRHREVDRENRRKSSAQSNNRQDCSDHGSLEDGRRSSKFGSAKADMFESSQREKRESNKQRKRERSHHTSERRSSKQDQNDNSGSKRRASNVEGSERIHKHRKRSSWDCNKVSEPTTSVDGGESERGEMDLRDESCKSEGIGAGFKSSETMSSKEKTGSEFVSKEVGCSEVCGEDEQAYRCAALAKLQEKKQLEQQLVVEALKSSHHRDTEIEPGSRRRLRI